jgi:ABC-type transporter Mla maintaining outer membrane lipid asymmetry permease subunit MlaE
MMVLGIDPIQRLVVPRVLACMLVAVFLNGLVSVVGVAGGYVFNVVLQDGTPGRTWRASQRSRSYRTCGRAWPRRWCSA